jgi:hypothetical protein
LNNLGSQRCTAVWTGAHWFFSTPPTSEMQLGPALLRWGGTQSWAPLPQDGSVLLASKSWDLGGGRFHYEYALFNLDSNRRVRRLSVPVGDASVDGIGFHDPDTDPTNDWSVTLADGMLTWETDPADIDPSAPALAYGLLYNFRFEADVSPVGGAVEMEAWQPTGDDIVTAAAEVPSVPASVTEQTLRTRLVVAPNPLTESTRLSYSLIQAQPVTITIVDAAGRLVRWLEQAAAAPGAQRVTWDGRDDGGRPVASGLYYARLRTGGSEESRAVVVVR